MNFFTMGLVNAGNAALRLGRALKALMFNPVMLIMAGVTAVMELWQHNEQEMERAGEIADSIRERANSAMQSTKAVIESSQIEFTDSSGKEVSTRDLDFQSIAKIKAKMTVEFDRDEAQQLIDEWANYIRQYSATPNKILNDVFFDGDKMRTLEEQFKRIGEYMGEVVEAQYGLHDVSEMFENAVNATDSGWFNDSVVTNIMDYEKAIKKYHATFADLYRDHGAGVDKIVRSVEKQNDAFANAVSGMNTYAEKFKYLVENWDKFQTSYDTARDAVRYDNKLYSWLYDSRFWLKKDINGAKSNLDEDLEIFFTHIEAELNNKGLKIGKLSKAQQQDLLLGFTDFLSQTKVTSDEVLNYLKKRFSERFKLKLDADSEKFKVKVNEVLRLLKELSESDWNVEMKFGSNVKDVIDEARKQYKAAKEYFENVKPIMLKLGVDFEMGKELTDEQINEAVAKADPQARDFVRQALQGVNEATRVYNQTMTASKHGGFDLEEKQKTGGGSKAYKDEFAKRWDERIRIMKEAYDWYDKWEKKVGNDAAIKEVNAKYADIFTEWAKDTKLPMTFRGEDIKEYATYVKQIRDDALARYQSQTSTEANRKKFNNGQEALRVYRQAVALLNDIKFDKFVKAGTEFKSIIDQTIEDLNTKWDIYKSVREATGNAELALDVAGIQGGDRNQRNSADVLKADLERRFHGLGGFLDITFDKSMDEEKVRNMFKNIIPDGEKEKIDGFVEAYKEWQKLQQNVVKQDISSYAKLLGLVTNYDAQVKKINDRLKQQKEENANLVATGVKSEDDRKKADNIAETQADWEKMPLSAQYANLYNNAIAMSRTEFEQATTAVEKMIARLKELGLITPEQAIQEQQKIDKARQEFSTTGFLGERGAVGQFISGGYDGLMNYYAKRRDIAKQNEEKSTTDEDKKKWHDEAKHYGKLFTRMSKLSDAAKDVVTAFSTLQSGLDLVTNLFDFMGNEGVANAVGDAAGVMGGAMQGAQSLSALGPWGMAAGAGLGLVSGLFNLHDKALEREISRLREDVQAIEANTDLIVKARERTLGYDTGDLRRSYAQQYAPNQELANQLKRYWFISSYKRQGFSSEAEKAMYEYYQKNSAGTGYQQELANLKAQREDYMKMYDAEQDKKKSSGEALEEYKAKIAELDDQIRHFAEDIAKELWNIDIKAWADQISDAIITAFENGESAVKAFNDAVKSIMQSVASEMLKVGIIEPMMQRLRDKLFGENGVTSTDKLTSDPMGESRKVLTAIGEYFKPNGEGANLLTAAQEYLYGIDNLMQQMGFANGLRNEDAANTLSSGVQGTSEETSGLLAGYVNALRQDVSINRILLTQYITELWPAYIEQVTVAVKALNNIDTNVALIRALLSENGAIYIMMDSMRAHLDNITNGNESIQVK